jgi:hypothetical protein
MVNDGVPAPGLAAAIAIFMELPVAFAVAVGVFMRLSEESLKNQGQSYNSRRQAPGLRSTA